MSLTLALRTALSGLSVNQTQINVTAANITNANTPGYTRKEAELASVVIGTGNYTSGGVKIESIARQIDDSVLAEMRKQTSILAADSTRYNFFQRTEQLFGTPDSNSSLAAGLAELESLLEGVAINPNDPIRQIELIDYARTLTNQINTMARTVQDLRKEADQDINRSVDIVNSELAKIAELNEKITRGSITGVATGDLEDQRDEAVRKIAEQLDVRTFIRGNNEMVVYTNSGLKLIDNTPQYIDYQAVSAIDPTVSYEDNGFNPIGFKDSSLPSDLTTQLRGGRMQGLIDLRDTILPDMADQLENIINTLMTQLNTVHNAGASYPPEQTLTGNTFVRGTDPFYATGTMRLAITDAEGNYQDYVDLDLDALTKPGPTTLNDFITAVNGIAATDVGGVAFNTLAQLSIVDDRLVIEGMGDNRVILGAVDPSNPPTEQVSGEDKGFSHYFGLNDFFTSSISDHLAPRLEATRTTSLTAPFSGTGTIRFNVTDVSGAVVSSYDLDLATLPVGGTINDLITDINAQAGLDLTASLTSDGKLKLLPDDGNQSIQLQLLHPAASETTTGSNFIEYFGFADPRHQSLSVAVNPKLIADPQAMARGQLNITTITPPILEPISAITPGDAQNAQIMANIFTQNVDFGTTGNINAIKTTLSNYAALFVANNARTNDKFEDAFLTQRGLQTELETRQSAVSGVDIEEEMANLLLFENAYNAAARVLRTTNEMFEVLESLLN